MSLKHSTPQVVFVAQCRFKCGERVRPCNTQYSKHLCLAALKKGCHILSYLLYRQGWLQRPMSLKHSKPQVVLVAQCRFKCGERVRPCNTQYSKHLCLAALKKGCHILVYLLYRQGWLQRPVSLKHSKPQVVLVAQCRFKPPFFHKNGD